MSLNDLACRHSKAKSKTYRLTDENGLYLEVRPSGQKFWRLRFILYGKEKTLTIGQYPSVTITQARVARDEARAKLLNEIDPALEKREAKLTAKYQHNQTLELVTREWIERNLRQWNDKTRAIILRRFEIYIFPYAGHYPVTKTPQTVLERALAIAEKHSEDVAQRLVKYLISMFRYANRTGRKNDNPADGLQEVIKKYKRKHYPSLDVNELPDFVARLHENKERFQRQTVLAVWALMLTAVRTSELINSEKDEFHFDLKQWIIPAHRMKMKQVHIVPLSTQMIEILKELFELSGNSKYVFASKKRRWKPISLFTVNMALKRMGYGGKMVGHGFRALFMGVSKEKLRYRHDIPDRQLAHVPKGTNGSAYDRASLLPERTELMQKFSDHVYRLIPQQLRSKNDSNNLSRNAGALRYSYRIATTTIQQINFGQPYQTRIVSQRQERPRRPLELLDGGTSEQLH